MKRLPFRLRTLGLLLAALVGLAGFAPGGPLDRALASISVAELRSHVFFLASDALRGRAPGSPGGAAAATYIASRFASAGLTAPRGSYYQNVPLVGIRPDTSAFFLGFETEDAPQILAHYGTDAVVWPGSASVPGSVTGDVVFAGYGIRAPEYRWDDFKGTDLKGKILLVLVNEPPAPPDEPDLFDGVALTYYGRWSYKIEEAERQGAAGVLLVHTPEAAGYPWSVVRSSWSGEIVSLPREADAPAPLGLEGWITYDLAQRMLAAAGKSFDDLYVSAARRDFQPVRTGVTLRARIPSTIRRFAAPNVAALLPGSDSALAGQTVIYTAHYDHLGVGPAVDGDSIYNGAYDNASGVALLLALARAFATIDPAPRRSILFLATTGEEAGMLGATYYVRHPLVPLRGTIAELNFDGANVWGETDDVSALGADRSTLGQALAEQAKAMDMHLASERAPEQGLFFRSDQFPFARAGVPALSIGHGLHFRGRPDGWGRQMLRHYDAERYHRPSDELDSTFTFEGGVQQARLSLRLGYALAQADSTPTWYPGRQTELEGRTGTTPR